MHVHRLSHTHARTHARAHTRTHAHMLSHTLSHRCLAIIANTEVIAVNQDALGIRGKLVLQWCARTGVATSGFTPKSYAICFVQAAVHVAIGRSSLRRPRC